MVVIKRSSTILGFVISTYADKPEDLRTVEPESPFT
jgi:hypothetical protein